MSSDKWSGSNPWLGLAPYNEGTLLFGRTQECAVLSEIIKNNTTTIVYGKSGIGKSSLLSAGISPILRSERYIPVPLRLAHNTEVSYMEQIENRVKELVDCKDELPSNVSSHGLWDFFHRHTFTENGAACQPVIILDQFEEIYTLTDAEHKPDIITLFSEFASLFNNIKPDAVLAAEASYSTTETNVSDSFEGDFSFEFSDQSAFAYNEGINFRFVICLREDKLYLLERNSSNIPSFKVNRYNLQALSPESALEVVNCPRPDLFTKSEATSIVDKLADLGDEGIRTVDPAILSLFLYKYYEKKGQANYDNIFADYYREATSGIKDSSLAFLEDHLLTLGGYRNQIPVDDALSRGVTISELDSLYKKIILRSEKRKGIDYIEFSHDRLCSEAKKSRDERFVKKQRNKMFMGISIFSIIAILGTIYIAQINSQKTEIENQKTEIENQKTEIENQKKNVEDKKNELEYANRVLQTQIQENKRQRDSLKAINAVLKAQISQNQIQRDSLLASKLYIEEITRRFESSSNSMIKDRNMIPKLQSALAMPNNNLTNNNSLLPKIDAVINNQNKDSTSIVGVILPGARNKPLKFRK